MTGQLAHLGLLGPLLLVPLAALSQTPPLPPPRPAELGGRPSEPTPLPPADGALGELPSSERACRARLSEKGVTFEPAPPISEGACGAPHPVRLIGLPGGVTVGALAPMTCVLAEALAEWSASGVAPAARERLGRTLSAIQIGTTYECRGQNRNPSAKLSEHAFANGADIAGFAFGGGHGVPVAASSQGEAEGAFLADVRAAACRVFDTVLGPGAEGHADHMHVDMRARPGRYRICE
ncbi:extensin-like domain-containing protein [Alsobacter sp. R-9]